MCLSLSYEPSGNVPFFFGEPQKLSDFGIIEGHSPLHITEEVSNSGDLIDKSAFEFIS